MARLTKSRTRYDEDFFAWTREVAEALRSGSIDPADIEHAAAEIEDMGKRDRRELLSRLEVLLVHLIKWEIQPERRGPSWLATIHEQRRRINHLLEDSPSLILQAAEGLHAVWWHAQAQAVIQTGVTIQLLRECPFTVQEILINNPDSFHWLHQAGE